MEKLEQTALTRLSWSWLAAFTALYAASVYLLNKGLPLDYPLEELFIRMPCMQSNYYGCWTLDKSNDLYTFLLHTLPNAIFTSVGVGALLVFVASFRWTSLAKWRREALLVAIGIGGTAGLVSLLKTFTGHYCPAQLNYFGGPVGDLTRHQPLPVCFPAGHPSPGFGLMMLYFGGARKPWARLGLYGGLVIGSLLGLIQMARGEHFLSHNIATLLTACFLGGVVWFLNQRFDFLNYASSYRRG